MFLFLSIFVPRIFKLVVLLFLQPNSGIVIDNQQNPELHVRNPQKYHQQTNTSQSICAFPNVFPSLLWPGNAGIVVPRIVIAVGAAVGAIGTAIFEAIHLALSARTQGLDRQGPALALLRVPEEDVEKGMGKNDFGGFKKWNGWEKGNKMDG